MTELERIDENRLQDLASEYSKIVIWGRNIHHTHYWVTSAYYNALTDLGIPCAWVDDAESSLDIVGANDFCILNSYDTRYVESLRPRGFLAFRKNQFTSKTVEHLDKFAGVYQHQQHLDSPIGRSLGCSGQVYYDDNERLLQQPWGSDLLYADFRRPVYSQTRKVYWTGSIWRQPAHVKTTEWGNMKEIAEMTTSLQSHGLQLVQIQDAYRDINIGFIRVSRLAPSIQGEGQVKARHLACRFFKNISYGQFCISNNPAAKDLLGLSCVHHTDVSACIDKSLQISKADAVEMCLDAQQKIRAFTVAAGLARAMFISLGYI